ncbi:MAG: hypothetical protein COA47_10690 [Robiginitomaculum sp.]|nr:MAG: hypothetical protein COA47_10690 [Robiginitomaculum sp.]
MPKPLKRLFLVTDISFLIYWAITALVAVNLLGIPQDWLFRDYSDPNIVAWNWSFMPLDILASISGLLAVRMAGTGGNWRQVALISMVLTFCAGFMAVSFWTFQASFDALWWAANLFLMLWPLLMFRRVLKD